MVKHTQTIRRQIADELFECVRPFCEIGAERGNMLENSVFCKNFLLWRLKFSASVFSPGSKYLMIILQISALKPYFNQLVPRPAFSYHFAMPFIIFCEVVFSWFLKNYFWLGTLQFAIPWRDAKVFFKCLSRGSGSEYEWKGYLHWIMIILFPKGERAFLKFLSICMS